jgi:L-fuconolactonase
MTELGLRLDLLIKAQQIETALTFAQRHPELPMVIDHAAKPDIAHGQLEPWASSMAEFARSTDVHCKLSGLATEAAPGWDAAALRPYVDHLFQHFGPSRLMWGSDWPVLNLAGSYEQWVSACRELVNALSPSEQDAIMGANAARFYGIK